MIGIASEHLTLADAAQDVCDSAVRETECYVTVNRIDALEACIPEQRAIELATVALIAAIRNARKDVRVHIIAGRDESRVSVGESEWHAFRSAAEALEKLTGFSPEPEVCSKCGGMPGGWDRPSPCPRCDGTGLETTVPS